MTGTSLSDQVSRGRRRRLGVAVAVLVVAVVGGGLTWWLTRPQVEDPAVAADALAAAWSDGRLAEAPFAEDAPADLDDRYTAIVEGLVADAPTVTVASVEDPAADDEPLTTTVELEVAWPLTGDRTWTYATSATLERSEDELDWSIAWDPVLVHPDLAEGLRLDARRTSADRGDVLTADGQPLVTEREVVDVGIEPRRIDDVEETVTTLTEVLAQRIDVQIDPAVLTERIEAADEIAFVAVVTLREDGYLQVQDVVQPLPGTVFRRGTLPLAPTSDFAQFTLGSVRPVTAEMIEAEPDRYRAGDLGGRGGLQAAYDERLFGAPGLQVAIVGEGAPEDPVLFRADATPGQPVTVTLDPQVQVAADDAVRDAEFPAAMAVLRPSDGHVLALANSASAGFDIARTGQLPPGSTFKPVTTAALLTETELTTQTSVTCPPEVTVSGRTITNAESQELGTIPFRTAFVNSCNTAFVQLSQDLDAGALGVAAGRFGIGQELALGMDAYAGQVPDASDDVELAAAAIGQGRTLVNPLLMARVMATIANDGTAPPLALVLEPAPSGTGSDPEPLPAEVAATLQELTRGVVTEGTGTLLADAPGGPVHGKTGTAEFDDADGQRRTHAWFVGYQDDLAFAVVVTDTPELYGGEVAAPIAQRFLELLAG